MSARPMPSHPAIPRGRIFVMLPAHLDTSNYGELFAAGVKADRSPWGLGWPAEFGYAVMLSSATPARGARGLLQRVLRRLIGADLVHGWANRRALNDADLILTHMEREWIAAAFALRKSRGSRPKLIANTIWLPGEWSERTALWRWAANRARRKVYRFTFNARPALAAFQDRFGTAVPCEYVPFGVSWESFRPASAAPDASLPVLIAGDDRYRDWDLVEKVASGLPEVPFLIASRSCPLGLSALPNVEIVPASGPRQMQELYERSALGFIPLQPNLHASGITVALETARVGRPIVITGTGGIDDYFADNEVAFIPPGDVAEARDRIRRLRDDRAAADALAARATARMESSSYESRAFAKRLLHAAGEPD